MKKSEFKSIISEAVIESFSTPSFRNELKQIVMEALGNQNQFQQTPLQVAPQVDEAAKEAFRNQLREQFGPTMMGGDMNFNSNSSPMMTQPVPSDGSLPGGEVSLSFINGLMGNK